MSELNPQREQMAHESMVRNLDAQAQVIWPQESSLFTRYRLAADSEILDAGCGTGEASWRLAERFPEARVLGVDVLESHLELARARHAAFAPRLSFAQEDIYALPFADDTYDLTVCRHVLQSIPQPERALAELHRVTRPGGYMHLLAEDYGMLHFPRLEPERDAAVFFREVTDAFIASMNVDPFIGRHCLEHLTALRLSEIRLDYVIVDTLRVPRDLFARIFEAWRDGYVEVIAEVSRFDRDQVRTYFEQMVSCVRDPNRYCAWMVPIVSACKLSP